MNAATRPPLYAYEEAYKSYRPAAGSYKSPQRRIRKFADTEYNVLANNITKTRIVPAERQKLQVYGTNLDSIKSALVSVLGHGGWKTTIDHPGLGYFTLVFNNNKEGKEKAQNYQLKIAECVGDPIVGYTEDRQYGLTQNGSEIPLTAAYNASNVNVNVEDTPTGESGRNYNVSAKGAQQGMDGVDQDFKTYLIAGIAIVALIVIILIIKKKKK